MQKLSHPFKRSITLIVLLVISLFIFSCTASDRKKSDEKDISETNESVENNLLDQQMCFKNVFPFADDTTKQDIEELQFEIKNNMVSGTYNWLPALKDQRKGTISGTIEDKTIDAQYAFMQEGINDTANLTIIIKENGADIISDKPELRFSTTIKKVNCK